MAPSAFKSYPAMASVDENELDPNSSYAKLLRFVDGPANVADFGCGPGSLARLLFDRRCTVTGVDLNPEHTAQAREYCRDTVVANLETVSLLDLFPRERFDIVICADIIEHLRNPEHLLAELHTVLAPGGFALASIPNIAHGAVRLAMLRGDFDYQPVGLLDDTHIRFFTHKSMLAMFEKTGYSIDLIERTLAPIFDLGNTLVPRIDRSDFPEDVVALVEADPDSETLQFIIKAVSVHPPARAVAPERPLDVLTRLNRATQNAATAERRLANLTRAFEVPRL